MTARSGYLAVVATTGTLLVLFGAPSWLALAAGLAIALFSGEHPPISFKRLTTYALQLGVVALGAGMNMARSGRLARAARW